MIRAPIRFSRTFSSTATPKTSRVVLATVFGTLGTLTVIPIAFVGTTYALSKPAKDEAGNDIYQFKRGGWTVDYSIKKHLLSIDTKPK
jgi:hypothetical protein